MKQFFSVKRVAPRTHVLYAHGWKDDTGDEKATIVLTVVSGSHSAKARADVQQFCDKLNAVVAERYGELEHDDMSTETARE